MLKNKIARKLSLYFATALLVFSIVICLVFMFLFRLHIIEMHKMELVRRATDISETLSSYIESGQAMGGYIPYLRFIGDIAGTDVWIVDKNYSLITSKTGHSIIDSGDLPENAYALVKEVLQGKTAFSAPSSGVSSELPLTVGAPLWINGETLGAVLLNSPVRGVDDAIYNGFMVLMVSIIVALFAAVLLSVAFSLTFTKPLSVMRNTALALANGDYKTKNDICQNDEIGQLAVTLDILADRLEQANRQSEKLDHMRKDFVANISHELKTPITVIRGSLEALTEEIVTDPVQIKNYYDQMLNETLFLQRLVGDLLDLSKLQNMDFIINKQDIPIIDIFDDVTKNATQMSKKKRINIETKIENGMHKIYADYGRIRQMLMIVIDNAIKFSPMDGTVKIVLNEKKLSVLDFGDGIAQEDLPYIFDRFYKSRSEQNKSGTGLGLAIAKQIAERHGIKIIVENGKGNGTKFTFEF